MAHELSPDPRATRRAEPRKCGPFPEGDVLQRSPGLPVIRLPWVPPARNQILRSSVSAHRHQPTSPRPKPNRRGIVAIASAFVLCATGSPCGAVKFPRFSAPSVAVSAGPCVSMDRSARPLARRVGRYPGVAGVPATPDCAAEKPLRGKLRDAFRNSLKTYFTALAAIGDGSVGRIGNDGRAEHSAVGIPIIDHQVRAVECAVDRDIVVRIIEGQWNAGEQLELFKSLQNRSAAQAVQPFAACTARAGGAQSFQ